MFNPDKPKNHEDWVKENQSETLSLIDEATSKYGYKSLENFEELELTPEEIEKILYTHPKRTKATLKFYINKRMDGEKVKVIAAPGGVGKTIAANIFSPAFYDGRVANHDYVKSEFENTIKNALELNKYKKN